MDHYLDVSFDASVDFPLVHQMTSFYQGLHLYLVNTRAQLGVTFPEMQLRGRSPLGSLIRLHGTRDALTVFIGNPSLSRIRSPFRLSEIEKTPLLSQPRTFWRHQPKSIVQMRKRAIKRHGLTEAQAIERYPSDMHEQSSQPYLELRSLSTHQTFKLFFVKGNPKSETVTGDFNTYGLSPTATLPWF